MALASRRLSSEGNLNQEVPTSPRAGSGLRLRVEAQRLAHRHCTGLAFRKAIDAKSYSELAHTAKMLLLDTPEAHCAGSRSYVGVGSLSEEFLADASGKVTRHTISHATAHWGRVSTTPFCSIARQRKGE